MFDKQACYKQRGSQQLNEWTEHRKGSTPTSEPSSGHQRCIIRLLNCGVKQSRSNFAAPLNWTALAREKQSNWTPRTVKLLHLCQINQFGFVCCIFFFSWIVLVSFFQCRLFRPCYVNTLLIQEESTTTRQGFDSLEILLNLTRENILKTSTHKGFSIFLTLLHLHFATNVKYCL